MKPYTEDVLNGLIERYPALEGQKNNVFEAYKLIFDALCDGHSLFTCGNGGSDADARGRASQELSFAPTGRRRDARQTVPARRGRGVSYRASGAGAPGVLSE